mmetsp:Transcript_32975/g.86638  ORF Transcript_32975/g.86638 Transcript_32975/m.86638 type:complete len:915 (+) Transcript_32975:46-2790(+)
MATTLCAEHALDLDLSALDLTYLSEVAQAELDEAAEAAALAEVAEASAGCSLANAIAGQPVAQFIAALSKCGLADELGLSNAPGGSPRLTIFAPTDAAMHAMPNSILTDPPSLYRMCSAHVCLSDSSNGSGVALQSLQGTVHCAEYPPPGEEIDGAASLPLRVGTASVVGVAAFSHGIVLLLDSALWALHIETEARSEQVWQKAVVPSPQLFAFGLPGAPDAANGTADVELQAQLYHIGTGTILPEEALRGGLAMVDSGRAEGVRGATFRELVIEHKPASAARKKATSVEAQRAQQNAYGLTFALVHRTTRQVLCAVRQPTAVTLRNSYHTLSEGEKAFRREYNSRSKPSNGAPPPPQEAVPIGGSSSNKKARSGGSTMAPLDEASLHLHQRGGGSGCVLSMEEDCASSSASELSTLLPERSASLSANSPSPAQPPAVIDVCPRRGPCSGGTEVWVHGEHLGPGVRVRFGECEAISVQVCSPSLLKCVTSPCAMSGLTERVVQVTLLPPTDASASTEIDTPADVLPLARPVPFVYVAPVNESATHGLSVHSADGVDGGGSMASDGGMSDDTPSLKRRLASILERIDDSLANGGYDEWAGGSTAGFDAAGRCAALPSLHAILDVRDRRGWGVLHHLAAADDGWAPRALAALLERPGCPLDARDADGRSALQHALLQRHVLAAQLLTRAHHRLAPPWTLLWSGLALQKATASSSLGPRIAWSGCNLADAHGEPPRPAAPLPPPAEPLVALLPLPVASEAADAPTAIRAELPAELQAIASTAAADLEVMRSLSEQARSLTAATAAATLPEAIGGMRAHTATGAGALAAATSIKLSLKSEQLLQRLQAVKQSGSGSVKEATDEAGGQLHVAFGSRAMSKQEIAGATGSATGASSHSQEERAERRRRLQRFLSAPAESR